MRHPVFDGNIGRTVISDHKLTELTGSLITETEVFSDSNRIYEVIRCISGIPLFVEDHLNRLKESSLASSPLSDADVETIKSDIRALIFAESITDGNIKVVIVNGRTFVFPSAFYYPPESVYRNGVYTGVIEWERKRPNVKMIVDLYKKTVSDKLSSKGPMGSYFETLLATSDGSVTEGSRSNVFFAAEDNEAADGVIWTAPDDLILKGITRRYVIEAIKAAGFKVNFGCVRTYEIGTKFKAAFLSGTSIGVLPIAAVEDIKLGSSSDPKIISIRREFDDLVKKYLNTGGFTQ